MPHGFVDKSKNSAPNHADKWLTLTKDDDYLAPLILHPTKGNPQATPPWQLLGASRLAALKSQHGEQSGRYLCTIKNHLVPTVLATDSILELQRLSENPIINYLLIKTLMMMAFARKGKYRPLLRPSER
jgi:hypothetical protein